jgi:hypothetical protein
VLVKEPAAIEIKPESLYDDAALYFLLGITPGVVARARREGKLRFTRPGRRTYYLGKWILSWLEKDGQVQSVKA